MEKTVFTKNEEKIANRMADLRGTRVNKNSDGTFYVPLGENKTITTIKKKVKRKIK